MSLKRIFRPTNVRIRLGVGLVLAFLFCIHCTGSDGVRSTTFVTAVYGVLVGRTSLHNVRNLERLAAEDHIALLERALEHYRDSFQDYTCTFIKQERINGQLRPEQWIRVKYMDNPFCVAMQWVRNAPIGDRVLYVQGKNNGHMLVRPKVGLFRVLVGGAARRKPDSPEVMANSLRPVTMFGFRRSLESLLRVYELAAGRGECSTRFKGYKQVAGRRVLALERTLPPRKDYPAKTVIWYLDVEHLVPLALKSYDWDDRLVCSYVYKDVSFNVGLSEDDFTPEANGMRPGK